MWLVAWFDTAIFWLSAAAFATYIIARRYVQILESDVGRLRRPVGSHWLWGHEGEMFLSADRVLSDFAEECGRVYPIKAALFHPDVLIVTDPGTIGHIFTKRPYSYSKGRSMITLIERVAGKGLNWADGDVHKQQRALLSPCFTPSKVARMENDIRLAAEKLATALHAHLLDYSSDANCQINLTHWTWHATLDVIGAVGFGHDFQNGSSSEAKSIVSGWNRIVSLGATWGGFIGQVAVRGFPFIAKLPLPAIRRQAEIKGVIKSIGRKIVEERLQSGEQGDYEDLLSVLIRTSLKENDIDRLLEQINTFVIAGHETTVTAINFALYELAKHKDTQDRLRRELMDFGSSKEGEPTYEDYQLKLPFLDAVCKETLRVYPSASRVTRVALHDDVLPLRSPITSKDGKTLSSIRISKGQVIVVPLIAINRIKAVWGPNANEFDPERWLAPGALPSAMDVSQGWSGLSTFSEGARMCIGHRLATFEFKIILSTLLKNFEFFDTGPNVSIRASITLQPLVTGKETEGIQLPVGIRPIS